jgi:hypothetical protein
MGFGKKTDFETGRTLNLDFTYRNMIKPAVEEAGLRCLRADEIVHTGIIDVPMYEQLLKADVVIADLSASYKNAFYELGVRHALRPYTTIVICEDGVKSFPFDPHHIVIRQYHHMGDGIDFEEVMRFRALLKDAIEKLLEAQPRPLDSPVYTFLAGLTPPTQGTAAAVASETQDARREEASERAPDMAYGELMEQADEAQKAGDFEKARALLTQLRRRMKEAAPEKPEDPHLIQRLALVTYKSKVPDPQTALAEARELLITLDPSTSNDTETLGLWGAVHKRLWDLTAERPYLDEAVRAYDRGFYLRDDYYNGINLAYLLNVRSALSARRAGAESSDVVAARAEAIADFVQAGRIRREVLAICESVLAKESLPPEDLYWLRATVAEAYVGLGDEERAHPRLAESDAPAVWMKETTDEQLSRLRRLLSESPLRFIEAGATAAAP